MSARMTLWKDRDPAAMQIPDMYAGGVDAAGDPVGTAARLAERGIQLARLDDVVDLEDLDGAAAMAALTVIRELTGHGIAVDWTLRMPAAADWRSLSHLYPPAAVLADAADEDITAEWRNSFHIAKFCYRHGPGFIEVRDRRTGTFRRLIIRNPHHEKTIAPLLRGVPADVLPEPVRARYLEAGLLHQAGRFIWWTPYRVRRWPLTSTVP